jgi:2-polyprenyl-6-methoxyphenol hydroxylase-like FAD-dependent oxidoreductase
VADGFGAPASNPKIEEGLPMTDHAVVIAGGGPTGLMLGAELALAGVDVVVVERKPDPERVGAGALGLHARTLEVFDQRGIADRFIEAGTPAQVNGFAGVRFDISDLSSRHPYGLALAQKHTERILQEWALELGVPVLRGIDVTGFTQDAEGIDVALSDGRTLRAKYLVGCDGGRSLVRKTAGIGFPGADPTISHLIAEAELTDPPEWGLQTDDIGNHAFSQADDGRVGILVTEREIGTGEPTLADLSRALIAHDGTDYGVHGLSWITRFTDMTRQADAYRIGRVLLAGDAAHIHYPAGGFGISLGVQDAVNLGWKLAEVVKGTAPETLLDTYHAERHPVAAGLVRYTMATVALGRRDERTRALASIVTELVAMPAAQSSIAGEMSGLAIHYDLGAGHPLLGRRMPDLEVETPDGPVRIYELLHDARPLLVTIGDPGRVESGLWADQVRTVEATYDGPWELPVIGTVPAPSSVLIRPDGYVAWVGQGGADGLVDALTTWFGPR